MMKDLRKLPLLYGEEKSWKERREEIRLLLATQMYGKIPMRSDPMGSYPMGNCSMGRAEYSWEEAGTYEEADSNSLCVHYRVTVRGVGGSHTFLFRVWIPEGNVQKHPALIYLGVNGDADEVEHGLDEEGMPPSALLANGYVVAVCMAAQIEPDRAEGFPAGLARAVCGERSGDSVGALAAWAEGMRIVLDLLSQREDVDGERIAVAGCSRCGKAALWCGALDERVWITVSFDSGCGGAAPTRGKRNERVTDMMRSFPHWLCKNVEKYAGREEEMPFDQHFLLALIAPRGLLVTSSTQDLYCDPYGEFLGLAYAQEAYMQYGKQGIGTWIWPPAEELLTGDGAAYYLREGEHGVKEGDWKAFLEFAMMGRKN